jgi:hypothetical protein
MQHNLINDTPSKRNYDFIDHIRCLSMMSIVFEHAFATEKITLYTSKFWAYLGIIQVAKFGTVIFFLLAGFLIGDKFTDYTPGQYLKRRFSNTFGPWLFWSIVFVIGLIINLRITGNMYHDDRFNLANILDGIRITYLYTNYWFIINFMISISLLLIFKKYLYSNTFGAILLSFTLIYCVNIHFQWFDPSHTIAILGFIFFLWMGAQLRKHWAAVEDWMKKISYGWLILAVVLTYALSCLEIFTLINSKSVDPYNTLRFTNVLFSLAVFFLLLKIKNFPVLNYLKPRQTTYGIYLIHYIILDYILKEILRPLHIEESQLSTLGYLAYRFSGFVIVYILTILLVMGINKTKAKRLIGN